MKTSEATTPYGEGVLERARRLRAARRKAGYLSAEEASVAHGWQPGTYRHHENGTRGFDMEQTRVYAQAFGLDVSALLGLDGQPLPATIGEALCRIRSRSGIALRKIARDGGWNGASSMQRYFSPAYDPDAMPKGIARRIASGMRENGALSDLQDEILALCGSGPLSETDAPVPQKQDVAAPKGAELRAPDTLDLSRLRLRDRLALVTLYESLCGPT